MLRPELCLQAAQRVAAALKPGGGLLRAASMPNPLPADPPKPDASAYIKQQSEKLTAAMTQVRCSSMHAVQEAGMQELTRSAVRWLAVSRTGAAN